MTEKNYSKIKINKFKLLICKCIGHNFEETDNVQLTHEMGNTKIVGYSGRTKEIKIRKQCTRCNTTINTTIFVEMDGYHSDNIPEPFIKNPMKEHLRNIYKK